MKAIDVAKYIVTKSTAIGHPVTNLKLQKLLYFTQGLSLSVFGKPAFDDEIEAWRYGPVVPNVYSAFSLYGALDISRKYDDFEINDDEILNSALYVLLKFKDTNAFELVDMTHEQGTPWYNVYNSSSESLIISQNDIMVDFSNRYIKEWFTHG